MAILRPKPILRASSFHWEKTHGVAEASDIRGEVGDPYPFFHGLSQVFDDDDTGAIGFTLVSDRTGREAVFALVDNERDDEGDFLCWHFRCVSNGMPGMTLTVFND